MSIKVECDICGARRKVSSSHAGRQIHCADCGATIHVPEDSYLEEDTDEVFSAERDDDDGRYSSGNSIGVIGTAFGALVVLVVIGVAVAFFNDVVNAPAVPVANAPPEIFLEQPPGNAPVAPAVEPVAPRRITIPVVKSPKPTIPSPHPALADRPDIIPPDFPRPGSITSRRPAGPNPSSRPQGPTGPGASDRGATGGPNFPTPPGFDTPPNFNNGVSGITRPPFSTGPDPMAIESFVPASGAVGTIVSVKGRGLGSIDKVLFLDGTRDVSADFSVVSDGELKVTVPALQNDSMAVPIAVSGPKGMSVTLPKDVQTLTSRKQKATEGKFFAIGLGGAYDSDETSRVILVQLGGMVMKGGGGNVFLLQNSAVMPRPVGEGSLVIHARRAIIPFQKTGTSRFVPVEEIYPSFVEKLFNEPAGQ